MPSTRAPTTPAPSRPAGRLAAAMRAVVRVGAAVAREVGISRHRRALDPRARQRASLAAFLVVATVVTLVAAPGVRAATTVSSGTTTTLSLDATSGSANGAAGNNTCTVLGASPVVTEASAGSLLAGGTLTLLAPTGFAFCADAFATVTATTATATSLAFSSGTTAPATLSADLATLTVTIATASSGAAPGKVTFSSIFAKPTGTTPTSGTLSVGGTAGASGTGDTLRSVAGSIASVAFVTAPGATSVAVAGALSTQPVAVAKDRFGNERTGDALTLAIDTGPSGATLACTSGTTITPVAPTTTATFAGCALDKSGTYRLKVTSGTVAAQGGDLAIAAIAPSGASVQATAGVNATGFISAASAGAVSVAVTFPTGGPKEAGTVSVTLASGASTVTGSATVTSGLASTTTHVVSGLNASLLPDGAITVSAAFTGGAASATTTGTAATKDATAPVLDPSLAADTVILRLATASDTGTYGDGRTNATVPAFTASNLTDGSGTGIEAVALQVRPTGGTYAYSGAEATTATAGIYTVTAATLADGTYDVQAVVRDRAGNKGTFPLGPANGAGTTVTIDTVAPVATTKFVAYLDGGTMPDTDGAYAASLSAPVNASMTVAVQATFAETGLVGTPAITFLPQSASPTSVTATESATASGTWRAAFDLPAGSADGAVTVAISGITDAAGNAGTFASGQVTSFTADGTAPTFTVTYNRPSPMVAGNLTITVTANESLTATPVVKLTVGSTTSPLTVAAVAGSSPPAWTTTYAVPSSGADGTATITVSGTDLAGNSAVDAAPVAGGSFVIDNAVPAAATVVQTSGDLGASSSDGITTAAPAFQVTVETGATANVAVTKDGAAFALQAGLATITGTGAAAAWVPLGAGGAALGNGTYVFTFTVADGAGNAAATATTRTVTLDLVPPVATVTAPTAGAFVNDDTPTLVAAVTDTGGTSTVAFESKGPGAADFSTAGSATMTSGTVTSGTWSFTPSSALAEGAWEVRAFVTDLAGNTARSASSSFTVDVTAPAAPADLALTVATDTGTSSTDAITGVAAQAFTGIAEAHATVALANNGTAIAGATATVTPASADAATGTFTIATALAAGTHAITATATDRAGNAGTATGALAAIVDLTAPTTGTLALRASDDTGTSTSDGILGVATPSFTVTGASDSGYAGAGIGTVRVETSVDNGTTWTVRGTSADTASPWTVEAAGLAENVEYRVRAAITDVAGNVATTDLPTSNGRIRIDVTAPVPGTVQADEADGTADDGVTRTSTATFGLTGVADAGSGLASIQLQAAPGAGQSSGFADTGTAATSAPGGAAALVTGTLADGAHTVRAVVTDVAGNAATTPAVDLVIDRTAPTPGTITVTDAAGTANDGIVNVAAPTFTVAGAAEGETYASPAAARIAAVRLEVVAGAGQTSGFTASGTATTGTFALAPAPLDTGTWTVRAVVTDLAGNEAATPGIDVTIDTVAPGAGTFAIVDADGTANDGIVRVATPTFAVTGASDAAYAGAGAPVAGIASVQLQVAAGASGGTFADTGTPATSATAGVHAVTAAALADGAWRARATVTDLAGNATTTAEVAFTVDVGAPVVTVTNPAAGFASNVATPTFTAHATDAGTGVAAVAFEVAPDGASPAYVTACPGTVATGNAADGNWWCVPTVAIGADGPYLVRAVATDTSGNAATAAAVAFVVDTTPPVAPTGLALTSATDTGTSTTDGSTNVTAVTVTGTAEAGSTVQVYDTGGTTLLGTQALVAPATAFSIPVTLATGTHDLVATATDAATNTGPGASLAVTVDQVAPTVALAYAPVRPVKQGDTLTITATASEVLGAAPVIAIREGDVGNGTMTGAGTTWTFAQVVGGGNGTATVSLVGTDVAGNAVTVASGATYPVDNVAPRLASVAPSGTAYNGTAAVAFTVTFSEEVTGVATANFAVEVGLGVGGVAPVVAGVTGSGTTWTVTVTTAGAAGGGGATASIGLALDAATLAGIVDVALNPVATVAPTGTAGVHVMGPAPTPVPPTPLPTATPLPTPTLAPTATAVAPVVGSVPGSPGGNGAPSAGGAPSTGGAVTGGTGATGIAPNGLVDSLVGPVAPLPPVGFPEAVASSRSLAIAVAAMPAGTSPEAAQMVAQALAAVPAPIAEAFAAALGTIPQGASGSLVAAIGSAPAAPARTFVETVGTLPAAETWQVTTMLGSLPPVQGAAFVGAVGSVPPAQARAVVQVLGASPPQAVVTLAAFAAAQDAGESARTIAAIADLAQSGTPLTVAAPQASTATATGREIVSFAVPVDVPPGATRRGDAEVAGAKTQGSPSRVVVILARPGQAARVTRNDAGAWPSLALPLGAGPLAGAIPVVHLPDAATALTFDPAPSNLDEVQRGSLGGGVVTPLGAPFTIDVEGPDDAPVGMSFPSIPVSNGGALAYLHETRDATGNFLGYLRAPATFVPATGRQEWTMPAADLRAALVLPVALRPARVVAFVDDLRLWSSPHDGAADFGPAGPAYATYAVVAPQVGGRILVVDEATNRLGWIDATGVAPDP